MTLSFCVQYVQMRGDCSLSWFWWNCWPLLLKLSFHKIHDWHAANNRQISSYKVLSNTTQHWFCDKVCQWLTTGLWFFSVYSSFLHQLKVAFKHHKTKPTYMIGMIKTPKLMWCYSLIWIGEYISYYHTIATTIPPKYFLDWTKSETRSMISLVDVWQPLHSNVSFCNCPNFHKSRRWLEKCKYARNLNVNNRHACINGYEIKNKKW